MAVCSGGMVVRFTGLSMGNGNRVSKMAKAAVSSMLWLFGRWIGLFYPTAFWILPSSLLQMPLCFVCPNARCIAKSLRTWGYLCGGCSLGSRDVYWMKDCVDEWCNVFIEYFWCKNCHWGKRMRCWECAVELLGICRSWGYLVLARELLWRNPFVVHLYSDRTNVSNTMVVSFLPHSEVNHVDYGSLIGQVCQTRPTKNMRLARQTDSKAWSVLVIYWPHWLDGESSWNPVWKNLSVVHLYSDRTNVSNTSLRNPV